MTRYLRSTWLWLALAAEVALGVINAVGGSGTVPTSAYLLPPLALALVERPKPVAWVAAVAFVLSITSGSWNGNFASFEHVIRVAIALLAGVLAVMSSAARAQLTSSRRVAEAVSRRLDAMLGALAEAVTVHDEDGQTVYANEAAVRLLGAESLEEVRSARPGELASRFIISHEDGTPVKVEEFPGRRAVADKPARPLLTRSVKRSSGESFWLLTKATSVIDEDGRKLAVNIIEDVTEAKEAELRQRFLATAGQVLASSLDYDETLQKIAQLSVPGLADWCGVDLVDDSGQPLRVALAHADPEKRAFGEQLSREYPPDMSRETGLPAVLRGGESVLYPQITDELLRASVQDERQLELVRSVGMRSAMIVPMRIGLRTIGALTFATGESERVFDSSDVAFAENLAARAATAVENARLYSRLSEVAHTLQSSLLPHALPQPPGCSIVASYRPGERGSEVGGDFYDVLPTDDGWMIFLGDVTGKGVRAAARTALVRHTARTGARFDSRPAAVAELVNDVLREQPELSIVTMVCALLRSRPDGGTTVTVTSAGHPLPLRIAPGGQVSEIGSYDPLLGAYDGGVWTQTECELRPGETLLFFTDGVTDVPGPGGRFGEERLLELVATGSSAATAVVERIDTTLDRFADREHADDRALLAVEFSGAPVATALGGTPPSA
jgi:PAS domain S-box-containing protein